MDAASEDAMEDDELDEGSHYQPLEMPQPQGQLPGMASCKSGRWSSRTFSQLSISRGKRTFRGNT